MHRWKRYLVYVLFWLAQLATVTFSTIRLIIFDDAIGRGYPLCLKVGIIIAKFGAYLANLNIAFMMISMSRAILTCLSMKKFGRWIAIDVLIPWHRWSSYLFTFGASLHVLAHCFNLILFSRIGKVNFMHPTLVCGYILSAFILLIALTAYCQLVRRKCFEAFALIHYYLWFPLVIMLIMHGLFCFIKTSSGRCAGSSTAYWLAFPILLFATDQIYAQSRHGRFAYISKVIEHPSNVFEMQMKQKDLIFLPGQYIYLNIPKTSRLEWHPFTLTSAPEEDHFSIHVRIIGDWTRAVWELLKTTRLEEAKIRIDGPYGCASQGYDHFDSIICVGAGIGQTPFASILKSLWFRLAHPFGSKPLKAVHFVGICKYSKSFEWFNDILAALEKSDIDHILHFHLFVTGMITGEQRVLLTTHHQLGMADPITGLQVPTQFGRPSFQKLFEHWEEVISSERIGVFYCGPPKLGNLLDEFCSTYSSSTSSKKKYVFHKEAF